MKKATIVINIVIGLLVVVIGIFSIFGIFGIALMGLGTTLIAINFLELIRG